MIIVLLNFLIIWLNYDPAHGGVSNTMIPCAIISDTKPILTNQFRTKFGSYFQLHGELTPTNNLEPWTLGGICIGPSNNKFTDYKILCLNNVCRIFHHNFNKIPAPSE